MSIRPAQAGGWRFVMPDRSAHQPWYRANALPTLLADQLARRAEATTARLAEVTSFQDRAAQTIRPRWAGERFDLAACVEALFALRLPDPSKLDPSKLDSTHPRSTWPPRK